MAQSIKLGNDTYLDATGVWLRSYNSTLQAMYMFRYIDAETAHDYTIGSNGYVEITTDMPTIPDGTSARFGGVATWQSNTGAFNITITGNGSRAWLVGTPGVTVLGLVVRYWYA